MRLLVLLGLPIALALLRVPVSASAAGYVPKETFGSVAQPSFTKPVDLAVDPVTGDLLVVDLGPA